MWNRRTYQLSQLIIWIFLLSEVFTYESEPGGSASRENLIEVGDPERATDLRGCPVPSLTASQAVGVGLHEGNILLQDSTLIDHLAHFNRERIPERVVHAKGAGAFGYFRLSRDISEFSQAKLFQGAGKITPVAVRFSTTIGETGSSDVVQDGRGFSIKFYTEDGNWDLVGSNLPVFEVREPFLFPMTLHSRKRNPVTHLKDPNAKWDFDSLRPETVFHTMFQMSGLGRPDGYRHMDGFGIHAFKLVNRKGEQVYCKFHIKTDQGIKNLTEKTAARLSPDYATKDLRDAIAEGRFPVWTFAIQTMTRDEAERYQWNPFDSTKIWLEKDFPLLPIGTIVLNQNPTDYFTQVEQSAFAVSNLVPGIEPSPDGLLQARMFAYSDAQRYRLGVNVNLIQVNRPLNTVRVKTYLRDGVGLLRPAHNGNGSRNYFPNSFDHVFLDPRSKETVFHLNADVVREDSGDADNFSQAGYYWRNHFDEFQQRVIVKNIALSLSRTFDFIQQKVLHNFDQVDKGMGQMLRAELSFIASKTKFGKHY